MSEPVSITVDRAFEVLHASLAYALENGAGKREAKAVAWDVTNYWLGEVGHYRTNAPQKDTSHD